MSEGTASPAQGKPWERPPGTLSARRILGLLPAALRQMRLRRVSEFTGAPAPDVARWVQDYSREAGWGDWGPDLELYLLVRWRRPEHVVETGVNRGRSTTAILRALDHDGHGRLTSIDLPTTDPVGRVNADGAYDSASVRPGMTGCEVPEYLRGRWTLILGDSRRALPSVGDFDFFFHDSDHSYQHQRWEYSVALTRLPSGGVLASDDVDWTPAFRELTRRMPRRTLWPFPAAHRGAVVVP